MYMLKILKHKVVNGALWYSLVGLLTSGMSVILLPVMTRWMTPSEFGILNAAMALSFLILPFVTVGLGMAVVRYYHEYSEETERFSRFFSAAFWFQIGSVLFVTLIGAILFGFGIVNSIAGVDIWHLIPVILLVCLNPPRDLGNQLLTAQEAHGQASINQLVAFVIGTGISLWLIGIYDLGAFGRLYGRTAGALAAALMLIKLPEIRANLKLAIDVKELKTALRFGLPYIPYAFAMAGMLSADKLILQHYMDMESVGIYSAAKTVAVGMSFVFVGVTRAWTPRYFALRDAGENAKVLNGQWAVLCILSIMVIGFVILAPVVFPVIVDKRYWAGFTILPTLAMGIYAYGLFMTQVPYISYLKKTVYLPILAGAGVLLNFLLAVYLIPKMQIEGAAWANLSGYLLILLLLFAVSAKLEKLILERVLLPCVSVALSFLGVWWASNIPSDWLWPVRILVSGSACIVAYVIWFTGRLLLNRRILSLHP